MGIKLTIGILVSNQIKYIRNCMESLKPLLEAVPSELIILDTKGEETDGSIAVVREYTDKIFPFTWCNDFAAARNALLSHARGEWFMYLDDDEWFDDVQELIEFFTGKENEYYNTGFYMVRNYDANGNYSMGLTSRMVRRKEDTRFVGRIHECFDGVEKPIKQFSCFVHHYGYAYHTEEAHKKKLDRNLPLLRAELEEKGASPRLCGQLVQELLSCKETEKEGISYCREAIRQMQEQGQMEEPFSQWLLIVSIRNYDHNKELDKVLSYAEKLKEEYPLNHVTRLALAAETILAAAGAHGGVISPIIQWMPMFLAEREWVAGHLEEAGEWMVFDFPRYCTEQYCNNVIYVAAVSANLQEQYETAYGYWKQLPWRSENFDGFPYRKELLNTLRHLKDKRPLYDFYRNFYKEEYFNEEGEPYLPNEIRIKDKI